MNKTTSSTNPRAAAVASLLAWEKQGRYANLEIDASLKRASMSEADRGLYTALVYGVIERTVTLDYILERLSSRPLSQIDETVKCAIRIGLYQLIYMDRIPPHAAVSETVELVHPRVRSFVNAILRSFQRSGCEIPLPPESDTVAYYSVKYSAPEDLCRFWISHYGKKTAAVLLSSTTRNPPVTVRVNTLKTTVGDILTRYAALGAERSPLADDMVTLAHALHIGDAVNRGDFFVQDVASRLCVRALDPKPGETVIDTCAAPGGKTLSMALDMENKGTIYAFDLHENKLSLIRRTSNSLGIDIVQTAKRDAKLPTPAHIGTADRVLCDAPCSGLGVIAKKPDIKYKPLSAIEALPDIQFDILTGASKYVRAGGVLVYSTCTLNPAENEGVVSRFLVSNPAFSLSPFSLGVAGDVPNGMKTFFPHEDGCDGFFIAKMILKER